MNAMLAAMNLKNRSQLRDTLEEGLASIDTSISLNVTGARITSGSTISRKQLIVDAALCCHWRQLLQAHDGPIYVFADSSPQAGTDWLLSILTLIKARDLEACVRSSDYLASSVDEFKAAVTAQDTDAMQTIAEGDMPRACRSPAL